MSMSHGYPEVSSPASVSCLVNLLAVNPKSWLILLLSFCPRPESRFLTYLKNSPGKVRLEMHILQIAFLVK